MPIGIGPFSIGITEFPIGNRLIPIRIRLSNFFFYKNQNYLKKKEKQNPNPIKHLIGKGIPLPICIGLDFIPI